jgi:nucleoside-diphosphate-sugar epimerase
MSLEVLVIGGTRFLGRTLVDRLIDTGATVTVVSRRASDNTKVESVVAERREGVDQLAGCHFDIVVDCICYKEGALGHLVEKLRASSYVVISTAWVSRLSPGTPADAPIPVECAAPANMLQVTADYLRGKAAVEAELLTLRSAGHNLISVRLPILWGSADHTRRLAFYCQRLVDGGPLFLINDGKNIAQISWVEDIVRALVLAMEKTGWGASPIWEALSDDGRTVQEWIILIAKALETTPVLLPVTQDFLEARLPSYLEIEPLWREAPLDRTKHNLFSLTDAPTTDPSEWLRGSLSPPYDSPGSRSEERALAEALQNA